MKKIKYIDTMDVRRTLSTGDSVFAEVIKIKENGKYKTVWSLAEQNAERRRMERK